jgi:hypothetical protein
VKGPLLGVESGPRAGLKLTLLWHKRGCQSYKAPGAEVPGALPSQLQKIYVC